MKIAQTSSYREIKKLRRSPHRLAGKLYWETKSSISSNFLATLQTNRETKMPISSCRVAIDWTPKIWSMHFLWKLVEFYCTKIDMGISLLIRNQRFVCKLDLGDENCTDLERREIQKRRRAQSIYPPDELARKLESLICQALISVNFQCWYGERERKKALAISMCTVWH